MFEVAWIEILFVGALALVVVGPRELPQLIRTVAAVVAKGRRWYREATTAFHQLQREIDLTDPERASADARPPHWQMLPDHVQEHLNDAPEADRPSEVMR